ncbi:double-stranded RNA-binding protein Staufen homolog 2 isoform X1 [Electrophorus electricus]|nr:double-stranded RNA-binding protein Staufen homolog 2 isoform X1 [Electrophorus electricus]
MMSAHNPSRVQNRLESMAQVKVQTSAPLPGPGLSPVVPPVVLPSSGALGLQSTINGTVPATTPACSSSAAGFVDSTVPAIPPGPPQDNMANPKEKTPMCLVNELARFNRIQPQYKLVNERGPAHAKIFTVQLCLGEQFWEAEGSSIKKAQHSTATKALSESTLPRPPPRSPKADTNSNPGSITPTVELNGLAMKRGEPAIYRPLEPKPIPNYRANYNFRGMFNQRYHYPVPKVFYVQLTVGHNEFIGEGRTRQAARHNAAMKALQALRNEPIPERPPQGPEEKKGLEENTDANKSEISLVYEIALKRNLPVNFEVLKESGPPHMKSFLTRVTVGEFSAEGEGNSKKLSKKRAAFSILQELKKLPFLPVVEKPKMHYKKRPKSILKTGPEYGQGMNPISRLAQIQQAKKEKEPEYILLSERGMPRRREFIMQVKVANEVTTGSGPNKKVAKRAAAEAMLLQLGFKASVPLQSPPDKPQMDNKGWNGQRAAFPEAPSNTQKGILHLSPDMYQEMEASRNKGGPGASVSYLSPKDLSQVGGPYYSTAVGSTATIARELLLGGSSPTAETLKGKVPILACGSVHPTQQLEYLARIQGFQVQYTDRQTDKDFLTYLTLSPVHMTFSGSANSIQASHDQAALSALKQLSEQGLDPVDTAVKVENGSCEIQAKLLTERADGKQTNSGTTAQDCKDPKVVV